MTIARHFIGVCMVYLDALFLNLGWTKSLPVLGMTFKRCSKVDLGVGWHALNVQTAEHIFVFKITKLIYYEQMFSRLCRKFSSCMLMCAWQSNHFIFFLGKLLPTIVFL